MIDHHVADRLQVDLLDELQRLRGMVDEKGHFMMRQEDVDVVDSEDSDESEESDEDDDPALAMIDEFIDCVARFKIPGRSDMDMISEVE